MGLEKGLDRQIDFSFMLEIDASHTSSDLLITFHNSG